MQPTAFIADENSDLAQNEIFGPVQTIIGYEDEADMIRIANNSRYGLAASVWSETVSLALHVAPQLKAGVVWVNGTNMFDAACGFGGYRGGADAKRFLLALEGIDV